MKTKGFTLIEMIVVIVILGVLAVTAAGYNPTRESQHCKRPKALLSPRLLCFLSSQKYRLLRFNLVITTSKCAVWSLRVSKFV